MGRCGCIQDHHNAYLYACREGRLMALPHTFFAPSFRYRHNGLFFAVLIGALVYLATFIATAETALFASTLTWDHGLSDRLTVEVPAVADESSSPQSERVTQAISILKAIPDVAKVTQVPDDDVERLLKPWITQPGLFK